MEINEWINKIHQGHTIELARKMPDDSVDMVITSPPYWSLRNYKTQHQIWDSKEDCEHEFGEEIKNFGGAGNKTPSGFQQTSGGGESGALAQTSWAETGRGSFCKKCHSWKGELGSEPDPILFIKHLVDIFREIKPKLKKSGSLWINLGDSYFGGSGGPQSFEREQRGIDWREESEKNTKRTDKPTHSWQKPKQLMLIPSRFAIAMQEDGWTLRNDIIWYKPGSMPTSVKDRMKNSYEHIFFFVKNKKYFFNLDEIREKHKTSLESLQNRINYDTERRGGKLQQGKLGTGQWSENSRKINPSGTVPQDMFRNQEVIDFFKSKGSGVNVALKEGYNPNQLGVTPHDAWKYVEHENEGNNAKSIKERMAYARRVEGKDHDSAINHPLGKTPEDIMQTDEWMQILKERAMKGGGKQRETYKVYMEWKNKNSEKTYQDFYNEFSSRKVSKYQDEKWQIGIDSRFTPYGNYSSYLDMPNPKGTVPDDVTKLTSDDYEVNGMISFHKRLALEGKKYVPNDLGKTPSDVYAENFAKNPKGRERLDTLNAEEKAHPLGTTPSDTFKENVDIQDDFFSINTSPFPDAHFAVFPINLLIKPIKAGCPEYVCKKCGKPKEKIFDVVRTKEWNVDSTAERDEGSLRNFGGMRWESHPEFKGYTSCNCQPQEYQPGVVLDPFMGSGTTAVASEQLKKNWIGFELNPGYIKIAEKRILDFRKSQEFIDKEDFKNTKALMKDATATKPLTEFMEGL